MKKVFVLGANGEDQEQFYGEFGEVGKEEQDLRLDQLEKERFERETGQLPRSGNSTPGNSLPITLLVSPIPGKFLQGPVPLVNKMKSTLKDGKSPNESIDNISNDDEELNNERFKSLLKNGVNDKNHKLDDFLRKISNNISNSNKITAISSDEESIDNISDDDEESIDEQSNDRKFDFLLKNSVDDKNHTLDYFSREKSNNFSNPNKINEIFSDQE